MSRHAARGVVHPGLDEDRRPACTVGTCDICSTPHSALVGRMLVGEGNLTYQTLGCLRKCRMAVSENTKLWLRYTYLPPCSCHNER